MRGGGGRTGASHFTGAKPPHLIPPPRALEVDSRSQALSSPPPSSRVAALESAAGQVLVTELGPSGSGESSLPSPQVAQAGPGSAGRVRTLRRDRLTLPSSHISPAKRRIPDSAHTASGERALPLLLQCGPGRWQSELSARGPRGSRPGARSVEETPVLGAEDWDFVGQLIRHLISPAKTQPSAPVSLGVRARRAPDGLPQAGSGCQLFAGRSAPPRLWVSPKRRPPEKSPAPPDLRPRAPKPVLEGLRGPRRAWRLPGHPRAASAQAEGPCWGWGRPHEA